MKESDRIKISEMINTVDGSLVHEALLRVSRCYWPHGSWLDPNSPPDMVDEFRQDNRPSTQHVADYVAVSALHHCYDGWSMFSQALLAETTATPTVSRHLGYYAELRATMSILAAHGIAVMGDHHVVLTKASTYNTTKMRTHEFAWNALEILSAQTNYAWFLDVICPGGVALSDWTEASSARRSDPIADAWLKNWSRDFHKEPEDRHSRNRASYHPAALTCAGPRPADDVVAMLIEMWKLVEPHGGPGFATLDRYLLRRALRHMCSSSDYNRAVDDENEVVQALTREQIVQELTKSVVPDRHHYWTKVLMAGDDFGDSFLAGAATDCYESTQLLSRALLLLCLATGNVAKLILANTEDARRTLAFWLHGLRVNRHLWPHQKPPGTFSDLWDDVEVAIDSISGWLHDGKSRSYNDLWRDHSKDAAVLATTERIFLWGSGL